MKKAKPKSNIDPLKKEAFRMTYPGLQSYVIPQGIKHISPCQDPSLWEKYPLKNSCSRTEEPRDHEEKEEEPEQEEEGEELWK